MVDSNSEQLVEEQKQGNKSLYTNQAKDKELEASRLDNRNQAMKLLKLGEFSREEQMANVERQNFIHSYLVDQSHKVDQSSNIANLEQEDLYQESYPHNNRLVKRLDRFSQWGLGGEILKRKTNYFNQNKVPTTHEVEIFLKRELIKDVLIVDFYEKHIKDKGNWGMLGTGFSNRHIYKVAQNLVNMLKALKVEWSNEPRIYGRKDDEWLMVIVGKDIQLHLFTEGLREDADLESKWEFFNVFLETDEQRTSLMDGNEKRKNPFKLKDL